MISNYIKYKKSLEELGPTINVEDLNKDYVDYWYLKNKQYHNYVWCNDIFSLYEIEKIKSIGKLLNLQRSVTGSNNTEDCLEHRRSFNSWIPINEQTFWIYQKLTDKINYINENFFEFDLEKIEKLQFTYYKSEENGFYDKHVDPLQWNLPHNRKLSLVVQLSDPEDYEGGDLIFHYSKDPEIIKKEMGMTVFFPSSLLHEVSPVTKGDRYSLVAWVHGK